MSTINRYSRQELVIGSTAQKKIKNTSIAIVGMGALGTIASDLLARMGIGYLTLIDRDIIELTNLQRQTLYDESDVGKFKAQAALIRLKKINSSIHIEACIDDLNFKNIYLLLKNKDIILDCTDNLATRYLINEFCRKNNLTWVHAAAIRDRGNVMTITPKTPCYNCFIQKRESDETCDIAGILNTASVLVATLQVQQVVDILSKKFKHQELLRVILNPLVIERLKTKVNPTCRVCQGHYDYLDGKYEPRVLQYLCSDTFIFFKDAIEISALQKKLQKIGEVKGTSTAIFFNNISIFSNGRIIIRAKSLAKAKSDLARYVP